MLVRWIGTRCPLSLLVDCFFYLVRGLVKGVSEAVEDGHDSIAVLIDDD